MICRYKFGENKIWCLLYTDGKLINKIFEGERSYIDNHFDICIDDLLVLININDEYGTYKLNKNQIFQTYEEAETELEYLILKYL